MRKPSENPKTKEKLLDCAQELMLTKGFAATSLDEICKKARVTKGCFFHYFRSKEDLGKSLLERFCCASMATMKENCYAKNREGDPLKRVFAYADFAARMSKNSFSAKGCLIGTFAQELSDTHPKIRSICARGFSEWAKIIKEDLDKAKAKYLPKAALDTKSLAEHFIAVFEGSEILAKAKQDHTIVERNMKHLKQYFKSVFKGH